MVFRPVLAYAFPLWDQHRQEDIIIFDHVQRSATRYVCNDYSSHAPRCVTDMLHELGWENLEERCYITRLSLLYKIHHGLVDIRKPILSQETAEQEAVEDSSRSTSVMRPITTHSFQKYSKGMEWPTKQCDFCKYC